MISTAEEIFSTKRIKTNFYFFYDNTILYSISPYFLCVPSLLKVLSSAIRFNISPPFSLVYLSFHDKWIHICDIWISCLVGNWVQSYSNNKKIVYIMFSQSYCISIYPSAGGSKKLHHALAEISSGAQFNPPPHQMNANDFIFRN